MTRSVSGKPAEAGAIATEMRASRDPHPSDLPVGSMGDPSDINSGRRPDWPDPAAPDCQRFLPEAARILAKSLENPTYRDDCIDCSSLI
jgi:hypothetical protein